MRHLIAGNRLGRNSSLRKATLRDLAKATLIHQRICTTKAKAKEARKLVDQLITLGKKGSLAHKRYAFAILCDHALVSELFKNVAPRFLKRSGGYTRIIPLAHRRGDNAEMVYLELTEKAEVIISKPKSSAVAKEKDKGEKKAAHPATKAEDVKHDGHQEVDGGGPGKKILPKHGKDVEKGKTGKKVMGGIKKIFQRKTGE